MAGIAGVHEPFAGDGAADVEEEEDVDEEIEEEPTSLEKLRRSGDPEAVDRTPVLGRQDIPFRAGTFPLGYPLQGIPRVAVTFNLNYVWDSDREEWVRQGPSTGGAGGAVTVAAEGTVNVSNGFFQIDTGLSTFDRGDSVLLARMQITNLSSPGGDREYVEIDGSPGSEQTYFYLKWERDFGTYVIEGNRGVSGSDDYRWKVLEA